MPFSGNIPYHVAVRLTAWYCVPVFCYSILFTHPLLPHPHTLSTIGTICDCSPLFATVCHYSRLFATICDSLPLFVTIRDCSPLFAPIRRYSRLFATTRDGSPLFATVCHCSPLFATVRHYSRLSAICHPHFPVTPLYPRVCENVICFATVLPHNCRAKVSWERDSLNRRPAMHTCALFQKTDLNTSAL